MSWEDRFDLDQERIHTEDCCRISQNALWWLHKIYAVCGKVQMTLSWHKVRTAQKDNN